MTDLADVWALSAEGFHNSLGRLHFPPARLTSKLGHENKTTIRGEECKFQTPVCCIFSDRGMSSPSFLSEGAEFVGS